MQIQSAGKSYRKTQYFCAGRVVFESFQLHCSHETVLSVTWDNVSQVGHPNFELGETRADQALYHAASTLGSKHMSLCGA